MLSEKTFDTGTVIINYAEGLPNGAPLVLLHGATARWQELIPLITELKHHWHVYACDKRGHGKSGRAAAYRAIDFFPDTAEFIQHQIGAPTVLLGHSGGAIASLGVAALIPELVRALILLDPPLYLREESIKSNFAYDYFLGVHNILTHQQTAREVYCKLFPNMDETAIQSVDDMIRQVDPEFVKTLVEDRYFENLDAPALLNSVTCPTLLLYGELEKGGVVRDRDVDFFLNHIPNGTTVQIQNAGHLLQIHQPARVLELIGDFTAKL